MRLQLELSEARVAELRALMEECGLTTQKELFNTALTLFEWTVSERRRGRIIASVDEANMKFKELAMPALEAVRSSRHEGGTKNLELVTTPRAKRNPG